MCSKTCKIILWHSSIWSALSLKYEDWSDCKQLGGLGEHCKLSQWGSGWRLGAIWEHADDGLSQRSKDEFSCRIIHGDFYHLIIIGSVRQTDYSKFPNVMISLPTSTDHWLCHNVVVKGAEGVSAPAIAGLYLTQLRTSHRPSRIYGAHSITCTAGHPPSPSSSSSYTNVIIRHNAIMQ